MIGYRGEKFFGEQFVPHGNWSGREYNHNNVWRTIEFPGIISYPGMKYSQGRIADHKRFTGIQIALA